ncbi:MAG: four helix bundle protein [Chitinophagales bacterium]|nr:four helix bundle protein [Chitinophagales bacterium]
MFLELAHTKLPVYSATKLFSLECYKLTKSLPSEEKFNLIQQIRRAAMSVHLKTAEGASRKSEAERKRFYEIAGSSAIEIDAALDIAESLGYCKKVDLQSLGDAMINCFKQLTGLINASSKN